MRTLTGDTCRIPTSSHFVVLIAIVLSACAGCSDDSDVEFVLTKPVDSAVIKSLAFIRREFDDTTTFCSVRSLGVWSEIDIVPFTAIHPIAERYVRQQRRFLVVSDGSRMPLVNEYEIDVDRSIVRRDFYYHEDALLPARRARFRILWGSKDSIRVILEQ